VFQKEVKTIYCTEFFRVLSGIQWSPTELLWVVRGMQQRPTNLSIIHGEDTSRSISLDPAFGPFIAKESEAQARSQQIAKEFDSHQQTFTCTHVQRS